MQRGDFEAAWQVSDTVLRSRANASCAHLPRHQQYVWNGGVLDGKRVLIRCYHGLGDTIQFVRYASLVRELARSVLVWAQPPLVEILRHASGVDHVFPLHDFDLDVGYDLDLEIMELPHVFRSTLATLPTQVPYLHPPPSIPPVLDDELSQRYHVGLVWQAGDWDTLRSVPISLLAKLAETPGVTLHALQRGRALSQWRDEFGSISGSGNVMITAQVMKAMDLIISVDSFPAHLAGALGRPVWTLLHSAPDWRWMDGREDSPWYPTMRLFRQERPGDWTNVLTKVAAALREAVPKPV